MTDLLDETRIVDQQAARIERLRGALGLVVTSDSHDLAKALAAETLRQDDATRR